MVDGDGDTLALQQPYLAGEVVDLVSVLALGELAVEQGHVLVRLVLEHLHPLPATGLVLRGLGY